MLEIKKLGEKTIRIADTATGRCYMGSATYKVSSVGGDTVCLQSIYEDNEPVFVAKVVDIAINGAAQTDVNACLVALNAFIGSFKGAAAGGGGGGVSPDDGLKWSKLTKLNTLIMDDKAFSSSLYIDNFFATIIERTKVRNVIDDVTVEIGNGDFYTPTPSGENLGITISMQFNKLKKIKYEGTNKSKGLRKLSVPECVDYGDRAIADHPNLEEVTIGNVMSASNYLVAYCPKLKKINVPEQWHINTTKDIYVSFRKLPMLEKDSIIKMFNGLQPITPSGHIATIILDRDKEVLLSEEEKNIVVNKGFELKFY